MDREAPATPSPSTILSLSSDRTADRTAQSAGAASRASRFGRFGVLRSAALFALLAGVVAPTAGVGGASVTGCSSTQASGTAGVDVASIVFVKRVTTITTTNPPHHRRRRRQRAGHRLQPLRAGREPRTSSARPGSTARSTNLTADFPTADFNGADLSFDATHGRLLDEEGPRTTATTSTRCR